MDLEIVCICVCVFERLYVCVCLECLSVSELERKRERCSHLCACVSENFGCTSFSKPLLGSTH